MGRSRGQRWDNSGGEAGKGVRRGLILGTVQSLDENQVGKVGGELGAGVLLGER